MYTDCGSSDFSWNSWCFCKYKYLNIPYRPSFLSKILNEKGVLDKTNLFKHLPGLGTLVHSLATKPHWQTWATSSAASTSPVTLVPRYQALQCAPISAAFARQQVKYPDRFQTCVPFSSLVFSARMCYAHTKGFDAEKQPNKSPCSRRSDQFNSGCQVFCNYNLAIFKCNWTLKITQKSDYTLNHRTKNFLTFCCFAFPSCFHSRSSSRTSVIDEFARKPMHCLTPKASLCVAWRL